MRGAPFGRSLATAAALATAVDSGLVETRAFISHPSSTCRERSRPTLLARSFVRRRKSCFSGHASAAGVAGCESKEGEREGEETYGEDDQRRFWDTAVEVCLEISAATLAAVESLSSH